jgi:hypothetical protein
MCVDDAGPVDLEAEMGVLSLHNECPPLRLGPETEDICRGMIIGEEGTSALLTATSDCMTSLAKMDDTVGNILAMWAAVASGQGSPNGDPVLMIRGSYEASFAALEKTVDRIDEALARYSALKEYSRRAASAGRGHEFDRALREAAGSSFTELVNRRIEKLRRLKVRVKVLRQLKDHGIAVIAANDFPEFFLMFMQPIRDMAVAVNDLYGEVVHGALASHQALFRACELLDEPAQMEAPELSTAATS